MILLAQASRPASPQFIASVGVSGSDEEGRRGASHIYVHCVKGPHTYEGSTNYNILSYGIVQYRNIKILDPTNHGFWNPLFGVLEEECRIVMFAWSFGPCLVKSHTLGP